MQQAAGKAVKFGQYDAQGTLTVVVVIMCLPRPPSQLPHTALAGDPPRLFSRADAEVTEGAGRGEGTREPIRVQG